MGNGKNVQDKKFVQDTCREISIDLMRMMKNILIIGFNNLMNYCVLKNGRLD